jgi:hypothetical protein
MKQIRDNIFEVTYSDLGKPGKKGDVAVKGFGTVMLDVADLRYIDDMKVLGYEPTFFVSRSAPLGGRYVVVSRQHRA